MATFSEAEKLDRVGRALTNGKRGDLDTISEALSLVCIFMAQIARHGWVTPEECMSKKHGFGWPAAITIMTCICGMILLVHTLVRG